jgi:hypothetical protein
VLFCLKFFILRSIIGFHNHIWGLKLEQNLTGFGFSATILARKEIRGYNL